MKKFAFVLIAAVFFVFGAAAHAQTPDALTPGWYYLEDGRPVYYYEDGKYYDPTNQTIGPLNAITPGVPNTGVGGVALYGWASLLISAGVAVAGTYLLTRNAP